MADSAILLKGASESRVQMRVLNTKARYKRKGALGTSESFVNQPPNHTELNGQISLSCIRSKAAYRGQIY